MFHFPPRAIIPVAKKKLTTFYHVPWSSLLGCKLVSFLQAKIQFSSSQGTREEGHRAASWHHWMDHAPFSEGFFTSLCNVKLFTTSSR